MQNCLKYLAVLLKKKTKMLGHTHHIKCGSACITEFLARLGGWMSVSKAIMFH